VYSDSPNGANQTLAGNDNACGNASEVSFPVVFNTVYQIRIGGVSGSTGTATLVRSCAVPPVCPEDFDESGSVGVPDLLTVINSWGPCKGCPADLDESGTVGVPDLLAIINAWGPC
jgi:hypothetical protein